MTRFLPGVVWLVALGMLAGCRASKPTRPAPEVCRVCPTPFARYQALLAQEDGSRVSAAEVDEVPGVAWGEWRMFRLKNYHGPQARYAYVTRTEVVTVGHWDGWRVLLAAGPDPKLLHQPFAFLTNYEIPALPDSKLVPEARALVKAPTLERTAAGGWRYVAWYTAHPSEELRATRVTITVPPSGAGTVEHVAWTQLARPASAPAR